VDGQKVVERCVRCLLIHGLQHQELVSEGIRWLQLTIVSGSRSEGDGVCQMSNLSRQDFTR
jgi:hypothetical protein